MYLFVFYRFNSISVDYISNDPTKKQAQNENL